MRQIKRSQAIHFQSWRSFYPEELMWCFTRHLRKQRNSNTSSEVPESSILLPFFCQYLSTDVETHHLSEINIGSMADFLIVVGDRNMKNGTIQAKRKGKLLELKVRPQFESLTKDLTALARQSNSSLLFGNH